MAVVAFGEIAQDRGVSGQFRDTFSYQRSFLIRVDDPATSLVEIATATGVGYLQPHPDDANCIALKFDCKVEDESGLLYRLTVTYEVPPIEQQNNPGPGIPADQWAASGSVTSGPVTVDANGVAIVNSANDPIPDLEKDYAEFRMTLTRCVADLSWVGVAFAYTNAVNSSGWNGFPPRTWKVHFQNANKRTETSDSGVLTYWETVWDFVLRADTWDLKPLDVGVQEIKSGKKKAIMLEGEPASYPVALFNGQAAPNQSPNVIRNGAGARVYAELDFSIFGSFS